MNITKYFNFLSLRYISNLSIIALLLSYYMNAFDIFLIFIPLVIVNFIIIHIIEIWNYDKFITGILKNIYPNKKERYENAPQFIIINLFWHIIPVLWIIYILESQDIIKIFRPNLMGIYLKSILIPIIYYYYESNEYIYGNINYLLYLIMYIILLLSVCIYLYLE